MKTYVTALFAAYLAIVSAAPAANDDGCDVAPPAPTSSCITTTTTVLATNAVSMMSTLKSSAASVQTATVSGKQAAYSWLLYTHSLPDPLCTC